MKETKIVWRLGKLPTTEELRELVKSDILTKEEAREILINLETEEERDKDSLKSEIKFLRELVEKLSKDRGQIVETIKYVEKPYSRYPWYAPYATWCGTGNWTTGTTAGSNLISSDTMTGASFTALSN